MWSFSVKENSKIIIKYVPGYHRLPLSKANLDLLNVLAIFPSQSVAIPEWISHVDRNSEGKFTVF